MKPPVAGEQWRLGAVSTGEWEGIPPAALLERAAVASDVVEILFEGADGFARSLPIEDALHPDTLLAERMNGEPLTPEHGAPLRLLVPGWYGMASVKWLARIEARQTAFLGHFQVERYVIGDRPVREMLVRSLIIDPAEGAAVPLSCLPVRGLAWTGTGRATSVELSDDDGANWLPARILDAPQPYTWVRWECKWRPKRSG